MKKQSWLILANSGIMKIFKFPSDTKKLVASETTVFPERHLRPHDLNSDKEGRSYPSKGHQSSAYERRKDLKKTEEELFATKIAEFLNKAARDNDFEKLYLAISKEFFGILKPKLSDEVREKIAEQTNKDLIHEKLHSIWSHFPSQK